MTDRPSLLASANSLRKGQRFVRPFRKDAGRDLCGQSDGVFQVSRTKPCAQFEALIAETKHGHWFGAYSPLSSIAAKQEEAKWVSSLSQGEGVMMPAGGKRFGM